MCIRHERKILDGIRGGLKGKFERERFILCRFITFRYYNNNYNKNKWIHQADKIFSWNIKMDIP